jgi:hypothetical protein
MEKGGRSPTLPMVNLPPAGHLGSGPASDARREVGFSYGIAALFAFFQRPLIFAPSIWRRLVRQAWR